MKYTFFALSLLLFSCSGEHKEETSTEENEVVATETSVASETEKETSMDGEFTYTVLSAEHGIIDDNGNVINQELGKAKVVISGDDITVYMESDTMSGKLMEHKSGKWIISTSEEDINAEEVGGCAGPTTINTEKKSILVC